MIIVARRSSPWKKLVRQVSRFGLVGVLNTALDLLVLNGLLALFPTTRALVIVLFTALAYSVGAVNSFLFNKYWTFERRCKTTWGELARFAATTGVGIAGNSGFIWLASQLPHPFLANTVAWTNLSKVLALLCLSLISYLGMRLWVFVKAPAQGESMRPTHSLPVSWPARERPTLAVVTHHSLSVVLPAYNEEEAITTTISHVLNALTAWSLDFEIIVVDDGSTDRTGALVAALAASAPQVRLVTHPVNQGYGAALVSGFAAATKELTFFMDADGQFRIDDLHTFFAFIDSYDAVIGYRVARQDSWLRRFNAWGWSLVIWLMLGVKVRDLDCAFKLLRTEFLRQHPLETRGAMLNAELLSTLQRAGGTYQELGVQHFPRQGGRSTGANLRVIARAFRELFTYARSQRRKQRMAIQASESQGK
jgi:putative flippase GtrA